MKAEKWLDLINYECISHFNNIFVKGGFGGVMNKIDIKIKIVHEGEAHRARAMPQNQVSDLRCY